MKNNENNEDNIFFMFKLAFCYSKNENCKRISEKFCITLWFFKICFCMKVKD